MTSSSEEPPEAATADQGPKVEDSLQRSFARVLNEELDRVGYPAPPARTNALSQDLGVSRMQAFRIARGDSLPTLKSMLKLQTLGVALDSVLERLQDTKASTLAVTVAGMTVEVIALPAVGRMPFVMSREGDKYVLRVLDPTAAPREGDMPVGGLRFTRPKPVVAVIEDDPLTLEVFCADLAKSFQAVPFGNEQAFRNDVAKFDFFDAIVLDWVLPGSDGAAIVSYIRSHTRVPVIVTTGHREASPAISEVLAVPDLYYVAKPVAGEILRATLTCAIERLGLPAGATR